MVREKCEFYESVNFSDFDQMTACMSSLHDDILLYNEYNEVYTQTTLTALIWEFWGLERPEQSLALLMMIMYIIFSVLNKTIFSQQHNFIQQNLNLTDFMLFSAGT